MMEGEVNYLFGYIMIVGGIALIVIATTMWYRQKKLMELMRLEADFDRTKNKTR